jgi:hypothetical protein
MSYVVSSISISFATYILKTKILQSILMLNGYVALRYGINVCALFIALRQHASLYMLLCVMGLIYLLTYLHQTFLLYKLPTSDLCTARLMAVLGALLRAPQICFDSIKLFRQ